MAAGSHETMRTFERTRFRGERRAVVRAFANVLAGGAIALTLPLTLMIAVVTRNHTFGRSTGEDLLAGLGNALWILPMVLSIVMSLALQARSMVRRATTLRLTYTRSRGAFATESLVSIALALCGGFLVGWQIYTT